MAEDDTAGPPPRQTPGGSNPNPPPNPSPITIGIETEGDGHWSYDVHITEGHIRHDYTVRLSWPDYDLWSHGRVAPERVVHAAFEFLLEREPATCIMRKFDCSVIRRYFPEVDAELPTMF